MGVFADLFAAFKRDRNLRNTLLVLMLSGGGVAAAVQVANRAISKKMDREDKNLVRIESKADSKKKEKRFAVDAIFILRLKRIFKIIVPGVDSQEFGLVILLGALLVSRTVFSVIITEIIGRNAQNVVSRNWENLGAGIVNFALITIPAAVINAGLKWSSSLLSLMWRVRLSDHVHKVYLSDTNFYKACNLGGAEKIDNADQRVTADIKQFCDEMSDLYTTVFKPCLDVVLFTGKLSQFLGWQAPAIMYGYFLFSGVIKRRIMPKFGKFVARESSLEGTYRTCHNRLIVHSEEVAFYKGADKERSIITAALGGVVRHVRRTRFLKFLIGVFDQLLVKYWASIAGYMALVYPIAYPPTAEMAARTTSELTRDYIRTSQYLTALSNAVGDLILSFNKLVNIAGYTARVSELLEMVTKLDKLGSRPFVVREDGSSETVIDIKSNSQTSSKVQRSQEFERLIDEWRQRADERDARHPTEAQFERIVVPGGGTIVRGQDIAFDNVDLVSPDGKLLVKSLTCEIKRGVNVMVTGPNGSGKSSLFRVIGELWPLHCGVLTKPDTSDILFVPQKPYLVIGTLRDQLIYPNTVEQMKADGITDGDLAMLLNIVDPAGLILKEWSLDDVRPWFSALSGGQKQRVAMARLFVHRPAYAILDECTSAVSDEVEDTLYETCQKLGITLFTVSHRKSLRRHHDFVLSFEGGMAGRWSWDKIDQTDLHTPLTKLQDQEEDEEQNQVD